MEEKSYQTEKGTIAYWITEEKGPKEHALVFLPGLAMDHTLFIDQAAYFNGKLPVLLWDAPGHGASRPFLQEYSLTDLAHWLKEILDKEEIKKAILIGHSIGGYEAQVFSSRYPDSVSGLVSVSAGPLKKGAITKKELLEFQMLKPVYRFLPFRLLSEYLSQRMSATAEGQKKVKQILSVYQKDRKEFSKTASTQAMLLKKSFLNDETYPVEAPCILICGEADRAGSSPVYSRIWSKEDGHPLWVVPNAGHNVPTDRGNALNALLLAFLQKLELLPSGKRLTDN